MRELKFRAWDVKNKRFVNIVRLIFDQFGVLDYAEVVFKGKIYKLYPSEIVLEQDTGLKDQNGKEIYEGDIVAFSIPHFDKSTLGYDGETDLVGKIVFDYDRFDIEDKDGVCYDLYSAEEGEVVGNIHENPELLGEK